MLQLLHIENIAVIEQADIELEDGLTVLSGETGAGKSIVIDSIGAVLGRRVSRDLVRTGAQTAGRACPDRRGAGYAAYPAPVDSGREKHLQGEHEAGRGCGAAPARAVPD